ncbi:molybdenum cofactor guanylyltransferase [Campylobacter sp. TTU-622]|uniref:molybdenum cofactor guanylyltransferase n=1 Tax=unclassified Campylobacter TaxID=2593542 RepID=UPI0019081615|nr:MULTISPECIES: molybdenum cofactor guanylyltransferase [unclassified Campylobacter]MBK1972296.1 molybdenum cofactor guanylyltransferase [Campylobacter sp. TTU_617]MBK1973239.1 molybdenum cofactor guanylyltransferase [Campylobacter sp. TTU-622]
MKKLNFDCIILCGGKSSRMGQDKSLLMLNSKTLTQFQFEKFSTIFKEVFISAKNDKFQGTFKLILDDINFNEYSPMLALYSILKNYKNNFVFIISVDMPNISFKEIYDLVQFLKQDYKIVIAKTKKYNHSLCGFYHSSLTPLCKELLEKNEHKIGILFDMVKVKKVYFDNEDAFINLNFYQEYETFQRRLE